MRILSLRVSVVLLLAFLGCVAAPAAHAHARTVRTEPAKDTEVATAPEHIQLWFNELLEDGFNVITVFPAAEIAKKKRTEFTKEKPHVNPKDRTNLSVKLKPLPAGEYIVEWRVLSRDGHSAPGRITFKVLAR